MTTIQLIKGGLYQFSTLSEARKVPFWKTILYFLVLSAFFAIPITYQINRVLNDIQTDGQKIAEQLPDFSIQEGELVTADKDAGFIFQTNSIIFTFDPDGKRSASDVGNDLLGNFLSIGLLQQELVIALPNSSLSQALFGENQFSFHYDSDLLSNFDGETLKEALTVAKVPWWIKILSFFIALYPTFLDLLITLFLTTIGASIYSKLRLRQISFFECFKVLVYCMTLPVIISSFLLLINPQFDTTLLITLMSLFIFFQTVKNLPKIELPMR